jgi:hypothetical protein
MMSAISGSISARLLLHASGHDTPLCSLLDASAFVATACGGRRVSYGKGQAACGGGGDGGKRKRGKRDGVTGRVERKPYRKSGEAMATAFRTGKREREREYERVRVAGGGRQPARAGRGWGW